MTTLSILRTSIHVGRARSPEVHRFVDGCREKQQELEGQLCWDFLVDQDGKAWSGGAAFFLHALCASLSGVDEK